MNKDLSKIEKPSPALVGIVRYFVLFVSKILWRIKFTDTQNIPQNLKGGLIITSNHPTYIDPFWVSLPVKRDLRFMAWDEAFRWFFIGKFIKLLGAFPVNTTFGSRTSVNQAINFLRDGKTLIVFPEAAREFSDGKFLPFKSGAAKIALAAGVPILPVTIRGANRVWARGMKYPNLGKVEIIYHPVVKIKKSSDKAEAEKLTGQIKEIIESAM